MTKYIIVVVIVVACIMVSLADRKKKFRKLKKGKDSHDDHSTDLDDRMSHLEEELAALKATVAHLKEHPHQNDVNIYFNGDSDRHRHRAIDHDSHDDDDHDSHDDHDHDHHGDDDHHYGHVNATHVYVHLEVDGHDGHREHIHHKGDSTEDSHEEHMVHAICEITNVKVHGHIYIEQMDTEQYSKFSIEFDDIGQANANFHLHVHEFGDTTGDNCPNVGGHFDPEDKERDVGDLGPVTSDDDGKVARATQDTMLTLFGHYSVLGRSITVHAANGDSLGCCVIGISHIDALNHTDD